MSQLHVFLHKQKVVCCFVVGAGKKILRAQNDLQPTVKQYF